MIEAMACGTPVIAYPLGSVPEVMKEGVSGYVVPDLDGAVEAAKKIGQVDRRRVSRYFEQRFTAARITQDYVKIYERMVSRKKTPRTAANGVLNWMKLTSPSSST